MPSVEQHLEQAKRNAAFAERLLGDGDVGQEWAMTAVFYAAVHYGRAVVAAAQLGTLTSHHSFESYLQRDLKAPPHIYKAYRFMKDEAEAARYDCRAFTVDDVKKIQGTKFILFRDWCENQIARLQAK